MPESLTPEQFTLSVVDGAPSIELHGVAVASSEGWSVLNRATLIVVDGPGDKGFLLPRMTGPDGDRAPDGWDSAVSSTASITVLASGTQVEAAVID